MRSSPLSKAVFACFLLLFSASVLSGSGGDQRDPGVQDPGVRGGLANTGGGLQARGIPIPLGGEC